jgi:hypothetical protein
MSVRNTAADVEEQATLEALRAQADKTAEEASQTLAELAGRLADASRPRTVARRLVANAQRGAVNAFGDLPEKAQRAVKDLPEKAGHAVGNLPEKLAGQRGAKRAALVAIPVLAVLVAIAVARRPPKGLNGGREAGQCRSAALSTSSLRRTRSSPAWCSP